LVLSHSLAPADEADSGFQLRSANSDPQASICLTEALALAADSCPVTSIASSWWSLLTLALGRQRLPAPTLKCGQCAIRVFVIMEPVREWRVSGSVSETNAKAAAPSERKLTSIVVADVVGYSRLTAADEEGTLALLREMRSGLVDPAVGRHRGRIVKTMGDGFLIEFPSVLDAVRSSLEIQHGLGDRKIADGSAAIRLRVGIHVSDVIVEPDGDLLGDGVNIAARLQEIADPGTVCLSEDAFHQVRNKISVPFVDKGHVELKNIPQPVRVYALQRDDEADRTEDTPAGSASAPPLSIVVLPFANLGQAEKDEQFADGITETLTTDLARIAHSAVIARNTAFTSRAKRLTRVKSASSYRFGISWRAAFNAAAIESASMSN
jgi:class 3 adenylate cyclase